MRITRRRLLMPPFARPDQVGKTVVQHVGCLTQQPAHDERIVLGQVVVDAEDRPVAALF
jgi:hypothetical protein